jgi:ABC-type antimicrobial peptide transport system permease subunit
VLAAAIGIEATSLVTLDEIVHRSLAGPRFQTLLLGLFAALALVLGAVGLYGVMSYLLSIRRQEIGIRLAIGAAPRDIFRLALQEALGLALAGVVIGLTLAFLLARSLAGFLGETLHGMGAGDPLSIGVAVVTFLAAALVAGLPPALRARRVDPIVALRGL